MLTTTGLNEYVLRKNGWLATGGKSQFNERLIVLKGRPVVAFPDVDGYEVWKEKAAELPFLDIKVSDLLKRMLRKRSAGNT